MRIGMCWVVSYVALAGIAASPVQAQPAQPQPELVIDDFKDSPYSVALADHPVMPLYFYVNKHLVKPELKGWYDNVMNVVYSNDLSLDAGAGAAKAT